jgi:hypothetical protein
MKFLNKLNNILFFIFLFVTKVQGQTVTPYVLNMGGGYSSTMEWSIGESVSIANFKSNGYSLNTGILQPLTTVVTAINEYGPIVFGNQIVVGPNPATKLLHIKASLNEVGEIAFQMFDSRSNNVLSYEGGTIYNNYEKEFFLDHLASGVYYMKIYFKSKNGNTKTGIYKIIKL